MTDKDTIDDFAVNISDQNKGYGKAILSCVLKTKFANDGYKSIRLYTSYINIRARRLYESLGFKLIGCYKTMITKGQAD